MAYFGVIFFANMGGGGGQNYFLGHGEGRQVVLDFPNLSFLFFCYFLVFLFFLFFFSLFFSPCFFHLFFFLVFFLVFVLVFVLVFFVSCFSLHYFLSGLGSLDGRNRAIVIAESLARLIAAIRIACVRWRSYLAPKHRN